MRIACAVAAVLLLSGCTAGTDRGDDPAGTPAGPRPEPTPRGAPLSPADCRLTSGVLGVDYPDAHFSFAESARLYVCLADEARSAHLEAPPDVLDVDPTALPGSAEPVPGTSGVYSVRVQRLEVRRTTLTVRLSGSSRRLDVQVRGNASEWWFGSPRP